MRPVFHVLVAVSALAFAPASRADMLTSWSYSTTPQASPIASDNNPFTGGATFSPVASTPEHGSADILLTNIRLFSAATAGAPDQMFAGGQYGITVSLHDAASGADGSVTFSGKLTGTFSLSSADLTNAFTDPTSVTLTVGSNLYKVTLGEFVAPGYPPSTPPGAIYAHVETLGGAVPASADAPEPSTLLLGCLGVGGYLSSRLNRRRREATAAS
jgi:hypothetical protein